MTTTQRSTQRRRSAKAVLPPASPAAPAAPSTLEALIAATAEATATFKSLESEERALQQQLSEATRGKATAAKAEDYDEASKQKRRAEALQASINDIRPKMRAAAEAASDLREKAAALFFADRNTGSDIKEVYRVTVVDPITQDSDDAYYVESGETVQLNVAGKHFESESYHVGSWAAEHGFFVQHRTRKVDFGGPAN